MLILKIRQNLKIVYDRILIFKPVFNKFSLQTYNSCARLCLNQETVCLASTAMKTENCVAKVSNIIHQCIIRSFVCRHLQLSIAIKDYYRIIYLKKSTAGIILYKADCKLESLSLQVQQIFFYYFFLVTL